MLTLHLTSPSIVLVQLRSSQVTQATLAEEVEMFIEIFLPGLSVRLIAQHVQVGDGELRPGLYVLHGEYLQPPCLLVPVGRTVRTAGVVHPVDDGEDSHEVIVRQRQGICKEDTEVSFWFVLVIQTSVEFLLGLCLVHSSQPL